MSYTTITNINFGATNFFFSTGVTGPYGQSFTILHHPYLH